MLNMKDLASMLGKGGSMPLDPNELKAPYTQATPQIWENYWNDKAGQPINNKEISYTEPTEEVVEDIEQPIVEEVEQPIVEAPKQETVTSTPSDVKSIEELDNVLGNIYNGEVGQDRGMEFDYNTLMSKSSNTVYPEYNPQPLNIPSNPLQSMDSKVPQFPVIGDIQNTSLDMTVQPEVNKYNPNMFAYTPAVNPMQGYKPEMADYGDLIPLNLMRQGKR